MASQAFLQARDFLLRHRDDYAAAYKDFAWPELTEFNWALDWFDEYARSNLAPALWVVEENGEETKLSFAELSARSNQLANWLKQQGVQRGDRILLMLPNQPALWETMLAAMKLGAVTIPATMLLTPADIADRMTRGEVKHVIVASSETAKFDAIDKDKTRIAVAIPQSAALSEGWLNFADAFNESPSFEPEGRTLATDPLLLYFTSGTTSRPKLVLHSHQSYPVGHLSTMYWIGLKPGDVHLNISSPGWAKHAYSCFFAPWNAGATVFIANQPRFNARDMLDAIARNHVTSLCAPPTVWRMFIQEDLKSVKHSLREVLAAGEPLNPEVIDQVRSSWALTIRDFY